MGGIPASIAAENERAALNVASDKTSLRKRLLAARSVLTSDTKEIRRGVIG